MKSLIKPKQRYSLKGIKKLFQEAIFHVKKPPFYVLVLAAVSTVLIILLLGLLLTNQDLSESEQTLVSESGQAPISQDLSVFVSVQDGMFMQGNELFRFSGTNAYYLPNYQKDGIGTGGFVNTTLDEFAQANISVIRMWAFYDGYDCGYSRIDENENVIQTSPGVYDEQALRDLDAVIASGKERGIRFILPFINYWDELGGICQYNMWAGLEYEEASTNMGFFLENSQTQQWYKDYIYMLMNRENTVTGVAYKDEPAIMSWQVMNEARNTGENPQILADWYQEIAQYIKSISDNQLISTGEEGFDDASMGSWDLGGDFTHPNYSSDSYSNTYVLRAGEGTSYVLNSQIPEIDFAWAHWYPADYGFYDDGTINENLLRAQHAWLSDHNKIAQELNKPFVLGEYGYPGWGDVRVEQAYTDLWEYNQANNIDGDLLWQYVIDTEKCYEFGGNICWPEARADNILAQAFHQHIQAMMQQ